MEGQGLVGLEARAPDGTGMGRIQEVITGDAGDGEVVVTHVVVETEDGQYQELPIGSISVDAEADFGVYRPDGSDDEPGEHAGEEVTPEGYSPSRPLYGYEDSAHDGQFVTSPRDPDEAAPPADIEREGDEAGGWQDEGSNTVESGYPRNDVYIDPDTGEEVQEPLLKENDGLADDIADLISETSVEVVGEVEGVVQLSGSVASQEDLEEIVTEIMAQTDVLGVDTGDVETG
ncbi:hypothetical protein GBA65_19245 [Rubrobacter marinus]|uniref:Uncharacterized protein n=1 Tax=Rubrobacter marinus TaxID=2653852 RepID=A0A6G8Q1F5_9ACTN|nr:hypothetical protein [Rubrobacter marinus]QIN80301.1 hypothetical protein GBA65_19245 [Rubrobacter marinus]